MVMLEAAKDRKYDSKSAPEVDIALLRLEIRPQTASRPHFGVSRACTSIFFDPDSRELFFIIKKCPETFKTRGQVAWRC